MTYSDGLAEFLKAWEGLKLVPSGDRLVPGILDVGYGHVIRDGEAVRAITEHEADVLLDWDLQQTCEGVKQLLEVGVAQHQLDALIAFAFNVGLDIDPDYRAEGLGDSTLLRYVNRGDFTPAAAEFPKWIYANGEVSRGLVKRRAAERAMFEFGRYDGRP